MIDQVTGLVVQNYSDQGDAPNRTGTCIGYFGAIKHDPSAQNFINAVLKYCQVAPNVYVRCSTNPSYNIPSDFSRDQGSQLMLGLGMAGRSDLVSGYYKLLVKNGFRHQNGDFIGSGEPGNIIRCMSWSWLKLFLWIFDIKFLYDVLIGWRLQTDYDNLFVMGLWFAKNKYWTPWAWLAGKLYNKANARLRVIANLGDKTNGCTEACVSDLWFIDNL
jgi:hypothetical protein